MREHLEELERLTDTAGAVIVGEMTQQLDRPHAATYLGAGKIEVVAFADVKYSRVELPNAPAAVPGAQNNARTSSITDMAYVDGRLYVAGLSNEEFSSKLRSVS